MAKLPEGIFNLSEDSKRRIDRVASVIADKIIESHYEVSAEFAQYQATDTYTERLQEVIAQLSATNTPKVVLNFILQALANTPTLGGVNTVVGSIGDFHIGSQEDMLSLTERLKIYYQNESDMH